MASKITQKLRYVSLLINNAVRQNVIKNFRISKSLNWRSDKNCSLIFRKHMQTLTKQTSWNVFFCQRDVHLALQLSPLFCLSYASHSLSVLWDSTRTSTGLFHGANRALYPCSRNAHLFQRYLKSQFFSAPLPINRLVFHKLEDKLEESSFSCAILACSYKTVYKLSSRGKNWLCFKSCWKVRSML